MTRRRTPEDIARGKRLQVARKDAGYETGADAAAEMDVEYSTYNSHENGWRGSHLKIAGKYADFFRVNWEWLLEGPPHPMRGDTKAQPDLLAGLSPEKRQQVLDFIDYLKSKPDA